MTEWTDKPGAVIRAEVLSDQVTLQDIHDFYEANPMPRWGSLHDDAPPHPSMSELEFYRARGNNIIVALDQDNMIWGVRINSRKDQQGLWLNLRREKHELHEPLGDNPNGGMTPNSKVSVAHVSALSWALAGGPLPPLIPQGNQNVNALDHAANRKRAMDVFNEVYGPAYGLV